MSWAAWLLFTGVRVRCVVLRVRCPGPLGSYSPVCPSGVLCRVCGVLCHLAPVNRCARSVCCGACTVSWAPWLLFTGLPVRCVVSCMYGVLGPLSLVHRCAPWVFCVAYAVSWATWLLFTSVPPRCVVLRVRCPGPLAPVHRCARLMGCVACVVSWATSLLFTGVLARCVVLCCVYSVLGPLAPVHRCACSVS